MAELGCDGQCGMVRPPDHSCPSLRGRGDRERDDQVLEGEQRGTALGVLGGGLELCALGDDRRRRAEAAGPFE